jgi:hypothetical protein
MLFEYLKTWGSFGFFGLVAMMGTTRHVFSSWFVCTQFRQTLMDTDTDESKTNQGRINDELARTAAWLHVCMSCLLLLAAFSWLCCYSIVLYSWRPSGDVTLTPVRDRERETDTCLKTLRFAFRRFPNHFWFQLFGAEYYRRSRNCSDH